MQRARRYLKRCHPAYLSLCGRTGVMRGLGLLRGIAVPTGSRSDFILGSLDMYVGLFGSPGACQGCLRGDL
jgi:hypothetical protein